MKKLLAFAALFAVVALTSCKYDDDDLWNSVHGLENRVAKLEELCKQMNTNISSLQTIVTALQNNVYVTGTTPLMKDGKEIGYTITFSKGNPITIYHGKDGQDGEDGITPTISVKKDTDGVYYWTLNGEFIVVDGGKIQAEGTNGTNGTTPQFKIENDYWFVSYDNGANWTQLGKATGEDGVGGDSMFSGVDYETSTDYVIFTLSNGTQIKLPTWSAFEALQRLCNETNTNLSALQTIVTALQNNDYITSVDPLTENGKVVGYTIKFAKSNPIVIYNGKDGADGNTPVIGVKKDTDGIYYWTLDGEFIVADVTPPVALAAYAGAGISGADPMKTGFAAAKLAIAAFIVPYIFVLAPELLMIDATPFTITFACATAIIGMWGVSVAMIGFCQSKLSFLQRLLFFVGGLNMIIPGAVTDAIGVAILAVAFFWQRMNKNKGPIENHGEDL